MAEDIFTDTNPTLVPSARGTDDGIAQLVQWNEERGVPMDIAMLKIMEEAGEVADAWIGVRGTNPRKGPYGTESDVANELADVIITAMVAIGRLKLSPMGVLTERLNFVIERIRNAG